MKQLGTTFRARSSRFVVSGVALAVVFLGLGGLSATGSAASAAKKKSPIVIGVVAPFTGSSADDGLQMVRAWALAEKNYGASVNGHPIKLVQFDDAGTSSGAVIGVKNALADHAILINGVGTSGGQVAVQPILEAAGVPVTSGSFLPVLTQVGDKGFFRYVPSSSQLAKITAKFIKGENYTRPAILAGTAAFPAEEGAAVSAALTAVGLPPVADISYTDGATSFTAQIEALKAANPDVVYFASYTPDGATACAQMKQLGLTAECISNSDMTLPSSLAAGGAALDGAYSNTDYVASQFAPFVAAWHKRFNAAPDAVSMVLGYGPDAVVIQALKVIKGTITAAKLTAVLHAKLFNVNLGVGKVKFDRAGDNECAKMYIGEFGASGNRFTMIENKSLSC